MRARFTSRSFPATAVGSSRSRATMTADPTDVPPTSTSSTAAPAEAVGEDGQRGPEDPALGTAANPAGAETSPPPRAEEPDEKTSATPSTRSRKTMSDDATAPIARTRRRPPAHVPRPARRAVAETQYATAVTPTIGRSSSDHSERRPTMSGVSPEGSKRASIHRDEAEKENHAPLCARGTAATARRALLRRRC